MLVNKDKISMDNFLEEFNKRFTNFCSKAPILLSFKVSPLLVHIYIEKTNEIKTFDFDFDYTVKQCIKKIKDWLIKTQYPVMVQTDICYENYTIEEIKKMVDNGTDTDEALTKKKIESKDIRWRIERIIVRRDELFVRNLEENKLYHYKLRMPCILFLKKYREKFNAFQAWDLFKEKCILLNEIIEEDKE